jgi:hypothetical protein
VGSADQNRTHIQREEVYVPRAPPAQDQQRAQLHVERVRLVPLRSPEADVEHVLLEQLVQQALLGVMPVQRGRTR